MKNIELKFNQTDVYGNVDGLSLQNIFYAENGFFPSCILFEIDSRTRSGWYFDIKEIYKWLETECKETFPKIQIVKYLTKNFTDEEKEKKENDLDMALCVILDKDLSMRLSSYPGDSYILFSNEKEKEAYSLMNNIEKFFKPKEDEKNVYYRLCCSNGCFYLEKGKIKVPENFDILKQYNDDFIEENEIITKFINSEEKSGLIILHGSKGTGKSTYIKNLVCSNPDKKFVFVPSSIIDLLGDPGFGSFLTSLNNHIIILEDCENIIRDRKLTGSASAVSLLLNMTDGILSDDLAIKFICTFNDDMKNIDDALLRKGRLISKYEFKNLSIEKTNILLEELGIEEKTKTPLSLAEIFNYNEKGYEKRKTLII